LKQDRKKGSLLSYVLSTPIISGGSTKYEKSELYTNF
jgi:hypothetical protein